jgi:hypothetical protein
VYDVGLGKETLSGALLMNSIEHVEGMFCLGIPGGEMRDHGFSDLGFLLFLVVELNVSESVGYVEVSFGSEFTMCMDGSDVVAVVT